MLKKEYTFLQEKYRNLIFSLSPNYQIQRNLNHKHFNFLQLKVIYEALKQGVDEEVIFQCMKQKLKWFDMEAYLNHEPISEIQNHHGIYYLLGMIAIGLSSIIVFMNLPKPPIPYRLKESIVKVEVHTTFEPREYIELLNENVTVIYPEMFQPTQVKQYQIEYILNYKNQQEIAKLIVEAVDTTPPLLQLTDNQIELDSLNHFDGAKYIKNVEDNYTLMKKEYVQIAIEEQDDRTIARYTAVDQANNQTSQVLTIHLQDQSTKPTPSDQHDEQQGINISDKEQVISQSFLQEVDETIEVVEIFDQQVIVE